MEIFFCSHCNQSIPLKDIQSGNAELRKGKYLCVTCREIQKTPAERSTNVPAVYLSAVLAVCLIVIGYLLFQDDLFPSPDAATPVSSAGADRAQILAAVHALEEQVERVSSDGERYARSGAQRVEAKLDRRFKALNAVVRRIEERANDRDSDVTQADVQLLKNRLEAVQDAIGIVREELQTVTASVRALERSVSGFERAAAKAIETPDPEPPTPAVSEIDKWISQLDDPVPGKRFNAVAELTRFKGDKVERALIGRLADDDFFIRRFVAEELGERKSMAAAPTLVMSLGDEEISVRDAAAAALRKMTGKNFGFKSGASNRERSRVQARWKAHIDGLTKPDR